MGSEVLTALNQNLQIEGVVLARGIRLHSTDTLLVILLVEKCNDFSVWPCARMSFTSPLGQSPS